MLIIQIKEGESLEKALRKYKKKFDKTKTIRQLRARQKFTKPSITKKAEEVKGAYRENLRRLSIEE